ncbi:unnamed protein product, partial [Gongylonema pulchrum]|uniref:BTB domain-containing protein n=1 Tax=Gongylonema pulchrum TaxID=637853 RepID=A0A183DZN9_9BILA
MSSCEVLLEEPSGDASSLAAADKSDEPMLTCLTFIFHWNIPIVRFIGKLTRLCNTHCSHGLVRYPGNWNWLKSENSFFQDRRFFNKHIFTRHTEPLHTNGMIVMGPKTLIAQRRTLNFIGSPKWPEMRTSWRLFLDHCKVFTQPNPLAIIFKLQLVRNEEYSAQITSMPDTYHSAFFSGGNYRILEGNSLLNCLTDAFSTNSRWLGGSAILTVEMRFAANDFQIQMSKVIPVQSLLRDGDFRKTLKDIYKNVKPDFIIKTLDGDVYSYKNLLYISSPYFRDLLSSDSVSMNQLTLNHSREAVLQTLSYMIFGVFESPEIVNPDLIPQMLKCAKQFQLRMTQFDDDIGRVLIFQLFKNLNNLDEVIKILALTHQQQAYYQVKRMCIAVIVEKHYRRF